MSEITFTTTAAEDFAVSDVGGVVEGMARVVAVEGAVAWLIPEQTSSCGHCASSDACASKGIGTLERRLEMRRFPMDNEIGLAVDERVVVGIAQEDLVKASLAVYGLPLLTAMVGGIAAQTLYGSDGITIVATGASMALGFGAMWLVARRLCARGRMVPRFLRRATPGETCNVE